MEKITSVIPQFMIDNSVIWGLLLYWLPLVICAVYFAKQFIKEYAIDVKQREESDYYVPTLTVGRILGWILTIGVPVANLVCALFHAGPHLFHRLFKWLGRVFDFPLVPDSAAAKQARADRKNKEHADAARKRAQEISSSIRNH